MGKIYLVTVLVVKYLILILASGNHHLLHVVGIWLIRFKTEEYDECSNTDPVVITAICGIRSDTGDPSYANKFVLARTHSGNYKKCADQCLKKSHGSDGYRAFRVN